MQLCVISDNEICNSQYSRDLLSKFSHILYIWHRFFHLCRFNGIVCSVQNLWNLLCLLFRRFGRFSLCTIISGYNIFNIYQCHSVIILALIIQHKKCLNTFSPPCDIFTHYMFQNLSAVSCQHPFRFHFYI